MFLFGLLLLIAGMVGTALPGSLTLRGDLPMTVRQAVYASELTGRELELSYAIPHTSLTFFRSDTGYTARFRIGVDLLDDRRTPVTSDSRERRINVSDYEQTVSRQASIAGTLTIPVPDRTAQARLQVTDLGSQRQAEARFRLAEGSVGLRLQFIRSGEITGVRYFEFGESLHVRALVLDPARPDSIRFVIRDERQATVLEQTVAVVESAGQMYARWVEPLKDSDGQPVLPAGPLRIEAVGVDTPVEMRAQAGFEFKVPFHLDDAAWQDKVDKLLWIATVSEMRELRRAAPDEREQAWNEFWDERDPTPTLGYNDMEEQYFERIAYAEENFSRGDRGYRSDRGRVYVKLGQPDERLVRPFEIDMHAYEVWTYYSEGLRFVFVDHRGFGEYVLESPRGWHGN